MDIPIKQRMISALRQDCYAKIEIAKCNIHAFLDTPVGVGDHPNIIETIQEQIDVIAAAKDRLNVLTEYFNDED